MNKEKSFDDTRNLSKTNYILEICLSYFIEGDIVLRFSYKNVIDIRYEF